MKYTAEQIDKLVKYAWMGLGDVNQIDLSKVENPFDKLSDADLQRPDEYVVRIISNPRYLFFTAKYILGVTLTPLQVLILQEMWRRPFPMLIAHRGFGKSFLLAVYSLLRALIAQGVKVVIVGSVFRQAKYIFEYAEGIWNRSSVLRSFCGNPQNNISHRNDGHVMKIGDSRITALPLGDGCLVYDSFANTPNGIKRIGDVVSKKNLGEVYSSENNKYVHYDRVYDNGVRKVIKITTNRGYEITGTHKHKIRVIRNGEYVWSQLNEVELTDAVPIDLTLPLPNPKRNKINVDDAYALGVYLFSCTNYNNHRCYIFNDVCAVRLGKSTHCQWKKNIRYEYRPEGDIKDWVRKYGIEHRPTIPKVILESSEKVIRSFLQGVYDSSARVITKSAGRTLRINIVHKDKTLLWELQYLLLLFGIISSRYTKSFRDCYSYVGLTSYGVKRFAEKIGFSIEGKQKEIIEEINSRNMMDSYGDGLKGIGRRIAHYVTANNKFQKQIRDSDTFTKAHLNTFLAYYDANECYDEFVENLKGAYKNNWYIDHVADKVYLEAEHTYDIRVPQGHEYNANGFISHNSNIRGERANITIGDEFAAMKVDVFENVVGGFSATAMDPLQKIQMVAADKLLKELELQRENEDNFVPGMSFNQTIISGTAYWAFNHFCRYWKNYRTIALSCGDKEKLAGISGDIDDDLDYKDFCVIRIPVELSDEGLVDVKTIAKAKATHHQIHVQMEYGAVFPDDSDGFYRRSVIERCVAGNPNNEITKECGVVDFSASLIGLRQHSYVMGIDPASERDNFAIVILEVWPDHRRVVYSHTTNRKIVEEELRKDKIAYWDFMAAFVNKLLIKFDCEYIGIDMQGGGISMVESFSTLPNPIFPIKEVGVSKVTDTLVGRHIVHEIQFANQAWMTFANHGLLKDLEEQVLLFPSNNEAMIGMASVFNEKLEENMLNIEKMKDELSQISHTETESGREKWGVTSTGLVDSRKDRYSALLIANAIARSSVLVSLPSNLKKVDAGKQGQDYTGPAWFVENIPSNIGTVVNRRI